MKKILSAIFGTAVLACAGSVLATPYSLTDTVNFGLNGITSESETINGVQSLSSIATSFGSKSYGGTYASVLEGMGDYISWTHNYNFEPMFDELYSAELTLNFKDDEKDCWFNWEIGLTLSDGGVFDITEVDTGDYQYDLNLAAVGDGSIKVNVLALAGDFELNSSILDISYGADSAAAPVPEPATMALFGVGLGFSGLAAVRRKKRLAKQG